MTQTLAKSEFGKLIHVARYQLPKKGLRYLMLRQKDATRYAWYERQPDSKEVETEISGTNVEDALRFAHRIWANVSFRTVICGFRYNLPERDEHGINALFHQMAASYGSMNGVYFDNDVGHNCFIQAASQEALDLWHTLQKEGKLG